MTRPTSIIIKAIIKQWLSQLSTRVKATNNGLARADDAGEEPTLASFLAISRYESKTRSA